MTAEKAHYISQLAQGLSDMSLNMPEPAQSTLIDFLYDLKKWNAAYNLTAVKTLPEMITRHVLDSLAVVPHLLGHRILDVGTGAGFPGIPLALFYPEKHFVLLDGNGKKNRFLVQAIHHFQLKHVEAVQARVESFTSPPLYDVIISRAVGKIKPLIKASSHLLSPAGYWLFMKGAVPLDELASLDFDVRIIPLILPGTDVQRHVIQIKRHNKESAIG